MDAQDIFKKFSSLKNDNERWKWLQKNQDKEIIVLFNADSTYIQVEGQEGYADFDRFTRYSTPVDKLIRDFGVRVETA